MREQGLELWRFETARFAVVCEALPEDMDPADSFDFEEDIQAVRNGEVEWFCARVRVLDNDGRELGSDTLGGCAYKTYSDFITAHRTAAADSRNTLEAKAHHVVFCHYFPDMVRQALGEARRNATRATVRTVNVPAPVRATTPPVASLEDESTILGSIRDLPDVGADIPADLQTSLSAA
jgi:hypothetical protein